MKRVFAFLMMIVIALGLVACKNGYSSKVDDVKDALEEKCGAKEAESEQYDKMVDSKYRVIDVASDFATGVYTKVKSKNFQFFGYHTVLDTSSVKSIFKYLKTDPKSESGGSVAAMEVLVVEFKSKDAAKSYYESIMNARKQTYTNNKDSGEIEKNEFASYEDYFAYACETDLMMFNAYASIDGSTVFYAFVEGSLSDSLKSEYLDFMKKMECSVFTL